MKLMWRVARWEFMRYFKWKQEIVGLAIMLALGVAIGVGGGMIEAAKRSKEFTVAVIDEVGLAPRVADDGQLTLQFVAPQQLEWTREQVGLGQLDGLVVLRELDRAQVLVNKEPNWRDELEDALDAARRARLLEADGISDERYERWTAPVALDLEYHQQGDAPTTGAERIAAGVVLFMLLSAVMTCFAYFFVSITSEKQARVAEQIVSAIPTQTWIDGKILGIAGLGVKAVVTIALWLGLVAWGLYLFAPQVLADFGGVGVAQVLVALLFTLLGLLFWSAFLAGVAATIDDPNASSRSAIMFVPMLPVFLMFMTLDSPDNAAVTFMSWFPVTSMSAMPVRVLLAEAAWWEVAGSALLLAATAWIMRRYASRVFRAAMFLYGKEPSWREVLRWARDPDTASF